MFTWKQFFFVVIGGCVALPLAGPAAIAITTGVACGGAYVLLTATAKAIAAGPSKPSAAPVDCAGELLTEAQLRRFRQAQAGGWNR